MEYNMSKSSDIPASQPTESKPGDARAQLELLYRAIGISAVAAAAAQVSRREEQPEKPKYQPPACLRDDDDDDVAA
jgi:hypothetical protein